MGKPENRVAEALNEAHVSLLADLRELEEAASPSSGAGVGLLRSRLRTTLAHLTEHFRFEEQNGYMDAVRKREPGLGRAIDELALEHGRLRQALEALIGKAAAAPDAGLADEIRDWIGQVRRHEICENALVQDTFNRDVGAED